MRIHPRHAFILVTVFLITGFSFYLTRHRTESGNPRPSGPVPAVPFPALPAVEPTYQGEPLSYWLKKLQDQIYKGEGTPDDAAEAIRAIGPNAIPFLLNWMPHPRNLRPDTPIEPMETEFAWEILGTNGKSAIPVLAALINQPQITRDDYSVWTACAKAISFLGPDAIIPILTAATNLHGNHEMWELLSNMGNLGPAGAPAIPAIIQWADEPDDWVREGVVNALGGIGQRPDLCIPVLMKILERPGNGMVRRDAATSLGAFAKDSNIVLPELIKLLKDPDWEAREGAVSGLGRITDRPDVVIPLIVPFLSDPNSVIERSAGYALCDLNCRSAYDALVENENGNIGDIVYRARKEEKARQKQFK